MDIKKAVELVNSGQSLASVGALFEIPMKRDSMRRAIEKAGYVKVNRVWVLGTQKNETTKETKKETTKEPIERPINEHYSLVRKRASFDIDVKLLKELKIYAIHQEKNVYEIVETAIRQYLKEMKEG